MAFKNENDIVKAPHQTMLYSNDQLKELVKCADPITGPAYFMSNYFYIQNPLLGKTLYKPYPYQERLLDTYMNYRYSVNMIGRQMGKCVCPDETITIKQKSTGKEYALPIGIYYEFMKAKKAGEVAPDIEKYRSNHE